MNESNPTSPDLPCDSLGKFLADAHYNTAATIANLRAQYDALATIDQMYCDMIENLNQSPEFVAGFFLIRTHSSFRGAARLCLSGEVAEAYMVLRSCLESALYGLYVADNTDRQEIWLRRHDDDVSLRRVKNEFTIRNVLSHLQSIDSKTHDIARSLYDRTIDYGGHPNERAVNTQIKTETHGSRAEFTAEYFLCGDLPHQLSLKSSAQIGICSLDIFYNVFRDRYRILGIDERLDQMRQGF
ncbi:MAG: hypothetical protein HQ582_03625 [Planctomycetes bacterium]|nr:hypothetical protein [Planctomycetota bacterium]